MVLEASERERREKEEEKIIEEGKEWTVEEVKFNNTRRTILLA